MKNREYAVEAVVQEFYGQSMTEDEGFIAPDFFAMARALIEVRAERDALLGNRDPMVMRCPECDDRKCHVNCVGIVRAEADALSTQLSSARVVTDVMVERFMDAYTLADTEDSTHRICVCAALTAALSEAP